MDEFTRLKKQSARQVRIISLVLEPFKFHQDFPAPPCLTIPTFAHCDTSLAC